VKRFFLLVAVFLFSTELYSNDVTPGFYFSQSLGASLNSDGLQLKTNISYKYPLFNSESILFKSTKIEPAIENKLTPSYDNIAFKINIEPIAVFDITFKAAYKRYFTIIGYGFLYQDGYDTNKLRSTEGNVSLNNKSALFFNIIPTFKIKINKIIAVSSLDFEYVNIFEDRYFLEETLFVNMYNRDWAMKNDTLLLYEFKKNFISGLYSEYIDVLNRQPGSGEIIHRINYIAVYSMEYTSYNLQFTGVLGHYLRSMHFNSWKTPYFAFVVSYSKK